MIIEDKNKEKQVVSSRVNKYIIEQYKHSEIPISTVVEASLIFFLQLPDEKKFAFLSKYTTNNITEEELKIPEKSWKELINDSLKGLNMSSTANISTTMGVGIIGGAIMAGVKLSKLLERSKNEEDDEDIDI